MEIFFGGRKEKMYTGKCECLLQTLLIYPNLFKDHKLFHNNKTKAGYRTLCIYMIPFKKKNQYGNM